MASPQHRHTAAASTLAHAMCVLLLVLLGACTSGREPEDKPEPARTPQLNTIEASNVGTRMIVTAGVSTVLSRQSFVVRDSDLPEDGLLVLGNTPTGLAPPDLVTVYGVVDRFAYSHFISTYELALPAVYARYENRKILVAADVAPRA